MALTAGVIAVQGDVSEHVTAVRRAIDARNELTTVHEIRTAGLVPECDVLFMPGGESTTISRLLQQEGIDTEIKTHVRSGHPLLATCAGLIIASRDAKDEQVSTLNLIDVTVDRNAFGRQRDSFESRIPIDGLDDPFPAVFIRAPLIDEVGSNVSVLAEWDDRPVAVRDGSIVATSFHPELTTDTRLHQALFALATPR